MRTGHSLNPEKDYIEQIKEAPEEFDFVEIAIGEMEKDPEDLDQKEIRDALDSRGLDLTVHLPFRQPLATSVPEYNQAKKDYTGRLLAFASELGAEKAVEHLNLRWGEEKDALREKAVKQAEEIKRLGEEHGVEVCFENTPFQEAKVADLEELGELLQAIDGSMCFDIGHAVAETGQEEAFRFLEKHRDLVTHLHVQDTRNQEDSHLALGDGDIDLQGFADALGDFKGTACLEIFTADKELLQLSREKFVREF